MHGMQYVWLRPFIPRIPAGAGTSADGSLRQTFQARPYADWPSFCRWAE